VYTRRPASRRQQRAAYADSTICEVDQALLGSLSGKNPISFREKVEHRRCMARGERLAFRADARALASKS
jgi:hypothetical protein